jgi:predicted HicB family RNase H-like nuclease
MTNRRSTPYPLRLESDLREQAVKHAKAERRSLNAWLQIAVEEKLERYKEQEKAA